MRKWISLAASLTLGVAFADGNTEVLNKLEAMQKQIQSQQEMINQLRSELNVQQKTTTGIVKQEVKSAVSQGLAQSGGSALSLGKGIDGPFQCQHLAPRGPVTEVRDAGVNFFGTLGDIESSFLTQCLGVALSVETDCRTPATFFVHQPKDQISVAMTRFTNQVPSFLQVDLYRGDKLVDSGRGELDAIVREDI